jgi:hypothetical protein
MRLAVLCRPAALAAPGLGLQSRRSYLLVSMTNFRKKTCGSEPVVSGVQPLLPPVLAKHFPCHDLDQPGLPVETGHGQIRTLKWWFCQFLIIKQLDTLALHILCLNTARKTSVIATVSSIIETY